VDGKITEVTKRKRQVLDMATEKTLPRSLWQASMAAGKTPSRVFMAGVPAGKTPT